MLVEHAGKRPQIDPSAWIAPDATICGDVAIGAGSRVLHGARMIGESGGSIRIGRYCIIMENAVVRSSPRHACSIGDYCLVGPNAHVTGAQLEDEVFIATSAAIFHGIFAIFTCQSSRITLRIAAAATIEEFESRGRIRHCFCFWQ